MASGVGTQTAMGSTELLGKVGLLFYGADYALRIFISLRLPEFGEFFIFGRKEGCA